MINTKYLKTLQLNISKNWIKIHFFLYTVYALQICCAIIKITKSLLIIIITVCAKNDCIYFYTIGFLWNFGVRVIYCCGRLLEAFSNFFVHCSPDIRLDVVQCGWYAPGGMFKKNNICPMSFILYKQYIFMCSQ